MGVGSYEVAIESGKRTKNGRKLEPVCYPAVVAKNIDSQGMGTEGTVSLRQSIIYM